MGNRLLDYGKPFVAAFNKENGKQKYFSIIFTDKDPILGFHIKQDTLFLLFKERISKHNLENGSHITEKTYNAKEFGDFRNFIGKQVFTLTNDSTFISLPAIDSTKCYIYSNTDKIYALDYNLNITETISLEDLYVNYLNINELKFLLKNGKTVIIDSLNNKIAELPISRNAFNIGDKLYDIQENSFFEINLNEITGLNNVP